MNDQKTIIIDNGSSLIRAGFSGENHPSLSLPTNIEISIGNTHEVKYPIDRGVITHFDELQLLYQHIFDDLHIDPSKHSFILTEPILNPKMAREKITEFMFETFNIPSYYLANQCTLSVLGSGRTTGIVLDVGHGISQVAPVYECFTVPQSCKRIDLAGQDVTNFLLHRISDKNGYDIKTVGEKKVVSELKETNDNFYVSLDYETDVFNLINSPVRPILCQLPNGTKVELSDELFVCPEILFKPQLNGLQFDGVDRCLFDCLNSCCVDFRKKMYENIVIVGGSSMFRGFTERTKKEISDLTFPGVDVNVVSGFNGCKDAAWMGASFLSNFRVFDQMLLMKFEYEESGSNCVNTKCIM